MINNKGKMRNLNKEIFAVLTFIFASVLFLISFVSAADPGHEIAVIGSGTFESGNYVFPNNLKIGVYN